MLVSVLARGHDAFASDDKDVGYTTLRDHRIETDNSQRFREKARPRRYAARISLERELDRLLSLRILSVASPGECPYASLVVIVAR